LRLTIFQGLFLMENAGRGATEVLWSTYPDLPNRRIAILAGKGKTMEEMVLSSPVFF